jgi:hypothetical protein
MKTKFRYRPLAIISIICGALMLLNTYEYLHGVWKLWPVFPLIVGAGLCLLYFKKQRFEIVLLGIGTYFICISFFFLFLNYTSWNILTDAWPLFIGFLGLSFLAPVVFGKKRGIFIFIALFLIFLSLVFILAFSADSKLWPVSLVLFGICLLLVGRFDQDGKTNGQTSNNR